MTTPSDLLATWRRLKIPLTNHELEADEVTPNSGVWVARDNAGHQHLLVLVDGRSPLGKEETHGLAAAIAQHRIAGRPDGSYVDLVCLDSAALETFAVVAAEIANSVEATPIAERTSAVNAALREWRWFWGVDPSRLTMTDAVGLFGELWFLVRWAGVNPRTIGAWEGSNGSRHDFQWPTSSVEVKTTARAGAVMHTIEHLEQLDDPVTGDLYLYSLRISRDPLAANSVHTLANIAREHLGSDPVSRSDLMAKLAQRGYTPAAREEASVTYRVVDEALYQVAGSFPRLTSRTFPNGLPQGITKLSYQLDMNACGDWRTDATPGRWTP